MRTFIVSAVKSTKNPRSVEPNGRDSLVKECKRLHLSLFSDNGYTDGSNDKQDT